MALRRARAAGPGIFGAARGSGPGIFGVPPPMQGGYNPSILLGGQQLAQPFKPPAAPSAPTPFGGDAQSSAANAQDAFNRSNQLRGLDTQDQYAKQDLATALQRRLAQHPKDEQAQNEQFNKSGLLFSGHLGQANADLETRFLQGNTDLQQTYDRGVAARSAARAAIEQGQPLAAAAQLAAAAGRQVTSDTTAADAGALVPPAAAPASTAVKVAAPKNTRKVGGRTQYRWSSGTWHYVPQPKR